ncbi:hypothetical protein FRC0436_00545 [Corynebacterium diphtheriae]|nr:hypothetical protein FRC0430_00460 [Corynebacterium diphtheriae]CAB0941972.1 hypothetical protein FRC0436_00545 [Corynebacterium diphtheriae]
MLLGPNALGIIQFIEHFGDYETILITAVFGALPFTMDFDAKVHQRTRTMWSYSVGMYLAQWGFFALLGVILFAPLFNTQDRFGIMLLVGFVGGFGMAAAVGGALDSTGIVWAYSRRGGHVFRNCRWRYLCPLGFKEEAHQRAARLG